MAQRKFISVHRKFTPEEQRRFDAARKWTQAHKTELVRDADEAFNQMESAFAAMQSLKARRESLGLSLGELAKRTGIDKSNLAKLEKDMSANPTIQTLQRIAHALGGTIELVFHEAA